MNFEEMKDWCNDAQRSLGRELDRLQEQQRTMDNHLQVLEAADELLSEIDRQKDELEQIIITYHKLEFENNEAQSIFQKENFERSIQILGKTFRFSEHLMLDKLAETYNSKMSEGVNTRFNAIKESHDGSAKQWIDSLLDEVIDPLSVERLSDFPCVTRSDALIERGEFVSLSIEFEDDVFLVASVNRFCGQFERVAFCGVGFPVQHVGERTAHDSLFDAVDGISADFPLPCIDKTNGVSANNFFSLWICMMSKFLDAQMFYDSIKQVYNRLIL